MKPAPFEYVRPASVADALEALAAHPDAKVLAGGQSLLPLLSMRLAAPSVLVDVNGLDELATIEADPDPVTGGVRVGALARHAEVEAHAGARAAQPLLSMALRNVAHPTIRNRGTTVGSIVHADAAAEMPMVLLLLDGHLTVASTSGRRDVPAGELFVGPLETSLRHDELALAATFPVLPTGAGVAIDEVSRRHGDYALCAVAAQVALDGDAISGVRAGYVSVADVPTVVDLTEELTGGLTDASLARAAQHALDRLDPAADVHATAAYRAQLVRTLTARVVRAAHADAVRRSQGREKVGS